MKCLLYIGITSAVIMSLIGCSSDYSIKTNVDPQNVKNYFKTSGVDVLSNAQLNTHLYKVLGTVEGSACQAKANQPHATQSQARVDVLRRAADMGANGLVYSTCLSHPADNVCLSSVSCYGKAVKLLDQTQ
ncbi:Rcs stress response system protein RcsF [Celerinatantimonas yamalensis]|uniref:Rcs stress response system protein RcsF n=1 Tax=Celerinatantimonas yamalensis TaxID=559956 RepID=A0ABW9G851_9GAMM